MTCILLCYSRFTIVTKPIIQLPSSFFHVIFYLLLDLFVICLKRRNTFRRNHGDKFSHFFR
ncbi:DUF5958 family protein [Anaerobacillus isosaccharinicus]|uniref:DUF5958 family protein n=1 Tax=Anaerobacillus isosaccharinicus TaxID=1532552 RepID=A0AC62A4N4_9BACI